MLNFRKAARLTGAVATVGVAALLVAGCTRGETGGGEGEASPGITDETLSLGISSPLSGPTAGPGS